MTRLLPLALAVLLAGCAGYIQQADQAAQTAADSALVIGRIAYCDAPTIGALRRHYGADLKGLGDHLRACGWTQAQIDALLARE